MSRQVRLYSIKVEASSSVPVSPVEVLSNGMTPPDSLFPYAQGLYITSLEHLPPRGRERERERERERKKRAYLIQHDNGCMLGYSTVQHSIAKSHESIIGA